MDYVFINIYIDWKWLLLINYNRWQIDVVFVCVLNVILTCEWYGPKMGRGLAYISQGQK